MDHLPIFLDVKGKRALVAGGGVLAARKADLLLRAGCRLTVLAPELGDDLTRMAESCRFDHRTGGPTEQDLEGCVIAFGCSADEAVNRALLDLAARAGILVNISDQPDHCDFIMPALLDRSPLLVAISSGGRSPMLTRLLKARLETTIPAAYGHLADLSGKYRQRIKAAIPDMRRRRRFWESMLAGPVAEHVFSGQSAEAEALLENSLDEAACEGALPPVGEVYLVGAGPGDPDLLTFRALRLMQQADVVLYDRLIGDGILNLVRRDARRIYVGKLPQEHTVSQAEISDMLIRLAQKGNRVLRLKGGDPFMFGRGGEEIEALSAHGITFQIIPGVTAASGCAAYAGIPLTHRDHAQACVFVTGHGKDGKVDLNWNVLVQPNQTAVVYMAVSSLRLVCEGFIGHGADPETPAAVIEKGTRADQRVITATLAELPDAASEADVKSPAVVIVGSVVTLRKKLSWFAHSKEQSTHHGQ